MLEDSRLPNPANSAAVYIIQAKNSNGFKEAAVDNFRTFAENLVDFAVGVDSLTIYNVGVREFISSFREKFADAYSTVSEPKFYFVYASKSDHEPSAGVAFKANTLGPIIKEHVSSAQVEVEFWGAKRLLTVSRSQPEKVYVLDVETKIEFGTSYIAMAKLAAFAIFLTNETGHLRQDFLEPNVRDYAGTNNAVNKAIRNTLETGANEESWWLNNGVTILAEKCSYMGGKIHITRPEIVNGLQTSTEIFNYYFKHSGDDHRHLMIRVVLPPSEAVRRRIIRATNSQTAVNPLSLNANDDIHHEIEDQFLLAGLFYDRRKGEHRRKRMPVSKIISMSDLAQAVIAVALRRPDDARARPRQVLGSPEGYDSVFDVEASRKLYVTCINIDRRVKEYLATLADLKHDAKNDIRFYVDAWIASNLVGKASPSKSDLAALRTDAPLNIPDTMLHRCCTAVLEFYIGLGGTDKVAKGAVMKNHVMAAIGTEWNAGKPAISV